MNKTFTIPADYGCLAIVAPDSYEAFVHENWELEQLKSHIICQNKMKRIVPWGCVSGNWIINIALSEVNMAGDREFWSQIETTGRLLITTYDSITMAAQFKDEKVPQNHELDQVFEVPSGQYVVKVIQNFRTSEQESEKVFNQKEPHFFVSLIKAEKDIEELTKIPWFAA